jgi:hypothetical protein
MTRTYQEEHRAFRQSAAHHGAYVGVNICDGFTPEQRKRFAGKNTMTSERVECRKVAMGAAVAEISYGQGFSGGHLWGVTVFDLCHPSRDHDLSRVFSHAESVGRYLAWLNREFEWGDETADPLAFDRENT